MATLTTQHVSRAGAVITPVSAAGGGDAMECGPDMMLEVVNGAGAPITVTVAVPSSRQFEPGIAITSLAVSVTNGTTKWIGPIDSIAFQDPTTGLATITYTSATSVTVAAVKLDKP